MITYNTAISASGKGKQCEVVLGLLAEMRQGELQPDMITYNAAVSASEKGQQWEAAMGLLVEMRQGQLQSNPITYRAAISTSEKGPAVGGAEMRWDRLQPDVIT